MKQNDSYPQIFLSNSIKSILATPKEPKQDSLRPIYFIALFLGLLLSFLIFRVALYTFKDGETLLGIIASVFCLIVFIFLVLGGGIMIFEATWGYKVKYKKWEKTIAIMKSNEKECLHRKALVTSFLDNRTPVEVEENETTETIKKGVSEKWFYQKIKGKIEEMGGCVFINKKIVIYKDFSELDYLLHKEKTLDKVINPKYYYPDIAIIIKNLYIDIEIDEPYTQDSVLPIHCTGMDDYRNQYFTSHGWEIIRFSEQQIIEHTEKCLETIINTIEYIIDGKCENPIPEPSGDWITSCWDEETANKMKRIRYRDSYLYDINGEIKIQ